MQLRWVVLAPTLLGLAQTVVAESTLDEIYGTIQDDWSCSKTISIPSGNPTVKMCHQKFFKVRCTACTLSNFKITNPIPVRWLQDKVDCDVLVRVEKVISKRTLRPWHK